MMKLGMKGNSQKGVTIIELAVVMAIIAIIGLFMSPALGEWVAGFRLRGTAKDLEDTLQQARLKAISTRNQYRVQLNINSGSSNETFVLQEDDPDTGWTNDGAAITLPKGVNIDNIDGATGGNINRTFRADGTAYGWAAGSATTSIFIENQRADRYRIVISQTGIIRMSEGW
jgi:prepilin-type N-terminal cleavage/methylation domain-containing protein